MALLPAERHVKSFDDLVHYASMFRLRALRGRVFTFDEGEVMSETIGKYALVQNEDGTSVLFHPDEQQPDGTTELLDSLAITPANFNPDGFFVYSRHEL